MKSKRREKKCKGRWRLSSICVRLPDGFVSIEKEEAENPLFFLFCGKYSLEFSSSIRIIFPLEADTCTPFFHTYAQSFLQS